MFAEVGCILAGIPLGYALRRHTRIVRSAGGMMTGVIYALLFLLGVNLGSNDHLFSRMGELGLRGFVIGLCCALGSIAVTSLIANKYFCLSAMRTPSRDKDPA